MLSVTDFDPKGTISEVRVHAGAKFGHTGCWSIAKCSQRSRRKPPLRRDRYENGGGVCFYIHHELSYVRRDDLGNCELELIWIEVSDGPATVLVGCCYRPPDSLKSFYE